MKIEKQFSVLLLFFCVSCGSQERSMMIKQGCYYGEGRPILKIEKNHGTLMIRGDIKDFAIQAFGDDHEARVTFSPGFMLNDNMAGAGISNVRMDYELGKNDTFTVKSPSSNPVIPVNWVAYGQTQLHLGKPC